jgi:thymidylate synthase ThyX
MRVLNVEGFEVTSGPTITGELIHLYDGCVENIRDTYDELISKGASIEDARGILPTNIQTNILVKMNLRTLVETCRKRSSARVQGEYREVIKQLKALSIAELPWTKFFFERTFDLAAEQLQDMIMDNRYGVMPDVKIKMIKLLDQMRMQS